MNQIISVKITQAKRFNSGSDSAIILSGKYMYLHREWQAWGRQPYK